MTFQNILLEQPEAGIWLLTINRPKALNALNAVTLDEIAAAIKKMAADDGARVLLVTGAGEKAFVAGADIAEMKDIPVEQAQALSEKGMCVMHAIEALPVPVIALVNGYCLGGGCDLSMTCDYTVAADDAQFGEPEIEFCSAPPFLIMPWVIGMKHTKELLLLGERIGAAEAQRIGIVNRVVPAGKLMDEARKVALRMARLPAIAMKQNKEAINRAYDMRGLMANIEYGQEMFCLTSMAQSPEGAEFRKVAREQGLKAAIRWRDGKFK